MLPVQFPVVKIDSIPGIEAAVMKMK